MPKFVMKNKVEGTVVLAGRYAFVDGEMETNRSDADKIERILCRFHDCVRVDESVAESESKPEVEQKPTLAAAATKTGAAETKSDVEPKAAK